MSPASLEMTAEELHSYLCRTRLPTLLVEGKGDQSILRSIGERLISKGVDVLPVGGKATLDWVYVRRDALTGATVVFMRDRDEFCVVEPPSDFEDYVLTTGYSIENDVLDRAVISRLAGEGAGALSALVSEFAHWFRSRLQTYILVDKTVSLSTDISEIVENGSLTEHAAREVGGVELVSPFAELDTSEDAWRWLRGKSLLRAIYSHFEGVPPKYSMNQICDLSIKMGPSGSFIDLVNRLLARF